MGARTAVLELLRESPEWRQFFRKCCETSSFRLRSQAWQWRTETRDQGEELSLEDLQDVLSDLGVELMPDSPGAEWDIDWEREMLERAKRYVEEKMEELPRESRATVDVCSDLLANVGRSAAEKTRVRYRAALRAWCQAVKHAIAHAEKGAA